MPSLPYFPTLSLLGIAQSLGRGAPSPLATRMITSLWLSPWTNRSRGALDLVSVLPCRTCRHSQGPGAYPRTLSAKAPKGRFRPHSTWMADNLLRHTVYVGLREDKPAEEVRRER